MTRKPARQGRHAREGARSSHGGHGERDSNHAGEDTKPGRTRLPKELHEENLRGVGRGPAYADLCGIATWTRSCAFVGEAAGEAAGDADRAAARLAAMTGHLVSPDRLSH